MKRALFASDLAERALELELVDACQEIAGVGHIAGNVIFGAGVEIRFCPSYGRSDTLILRRSSHHPLLY